MKEKSTKRVKGKILSATVSRSADHWFVSVNTIQIISDPIPVTGPVVGIDLGLKTFATISDGTKIISSKPLKKELIPNISTTADIPYAIFLYSMNLKERCLNIFLDKPVK